MNKRLLTAAMALAFSLLTVPALARSYDDGDGGGFRQHSIEPSYPHSYRDDDDEAPSYRREQKQRHGRKVERKKSHVQAPRRAEKREASLRQAPATAPAASTATTTVAPAPAASTATKKRHAGGGGLRGCLKPAARALLDRLEAHFGPMQIISTCRAGARIAGTGRISKHASGEAIDFNAGNRKGEVVRWLIANHKSGGIMTYAGMSHIHIDVGYHFVALNSGGGR